MSNENKPTPVETLRDGRLKATIWENQNENGSYHSVSLAKTYEDKQGRLQDSHSFTGSELLRIAELARESHALCAETDQLNAPKAQSLHQPRSVSERGPEIGKSRRALRFLGRTPVFERDR